MNLTTLKLKSFEATHKTPYCKQNFQILRVGGNTLVHSINSIFFLSISILSRLFGSKLSEYYGSLANYHFDRAVNPLITLLIFGGQVIDFSINRSARGHIPLADGESELDGLKRVYGTEEIDQRLLWKPPYNYKINFQNLKQLKDGFCFGSSAHFVSSYLKALQEGKSPLEALEKIAPLYRTGAPDTAQLAQIFYAAADQEKLHDQINQKLIECTKDIKLGEVKRLSALNSELKKIYSETLNIRKIPIYMMNLLITESFIYDKEKMKEDLSGAAFEEFTQSLPHGVYQLTLNPDPNCVMPGHSLVFIKTDQKSFLFDINFGTVILNSSKKISALANLYYPKSKGSCDVIFNLCQMK